MKYRIIAALLTVASLAACPKAAAQSVQVDFDKKIILTDSLHMPSNTSAGALVSLLPELLQRPGESLLSNYDIKVNGTSVSQASDVALAQLMIDEIEKIEVSESPLDAYNKNGQGGTINLVLRSHGPTTDKIWGGAGLQGSYPLDLAPQLNLGHRSDKLLVRGVLLGDFYRAHTASETVGYDSEGAVTDDKRSKTDSRYYAELAQLSLQYMPTKRDELKCNLSESFVYNRKTASGQFGNTMMSDNLAQTTNVGILLRYTHSFNRSQLVAETQYGFTPGNKDKDVPDVQLYHSDFRNHGISGKVEYKQSLLPDGSKAKMNLTLGTNLNGSLKRAVTTSQLAISGQEDRSEPQNNTFFVQPYLAYDVTAGRFRLKAIAEYQYYLYDIHRLDSGYCSISHDFTGKIMAEYHFTPHQCLRLIADRKLQRPTEDQLYPRLTYSIENMKYMKGNPDLRPVLSHEIRLDYISDYRWQEHTLVVDAAVSYNHISHIITSAVEGGSSSGGMLGQTLQYISYTNGGANHIANANAMLLYRYRYFTLSLVGNVYHREIPMENGKNHYTYGIVALHPQFALPEGWQGGTMITFYSPVNRLDGSLGGCTTASISIGKRWQGLYVYMFDTVALQKNATDVSYSADGSRTETLYDLVRNSVGIGVKYSF